MRGIDTRPRLVGSHLAMSEGAAVETVAAAAIIRGDDDDDDDRATCCSAMRVALTMTLMVAPGIMILAKDCHKSVSAVARAVWYIRTLLFLVVVVVVLLL